MAGAIMLATRGANCHALTAERRPRGRAGGWDPTIFTQLKGNSPP